MMYLLRNIAIGIDESKDGIDFNLNLYSKGTKADFRDDFPRSIVRVTGARFEIVNKSTRSLNILNFFFGVILNNKWEKVFTSSFFNKNGYTIETLKNFEIAFEGKEIIDIFDDYKEEQGVLIILNDRSKLYHSKFFDGDFIESQLDNLNNDTDPEYQN